LLNCVDAVTGAKQERAPVPKLPETGARRDVNSVDDDGSRCCRQSQIRDPASGTPEVLRVS